MCFKRCTNKTDAGDKKTSIMISLITINSPKSSSPKSSWRGRKLVYFLVGLVIAAALIGPFIWSCLEHNSDIKEALSIWNSFVGIALGYVATTLAIVSIVLSFKTYDDALKVQENAVETLSEIKQVRQDVNDIKNGRLSSGKGDSVQTTDAKTQSEWGDEPEDDSADC